MNAFTWERKDIGFVCLLRIQDQTHKLTRFKTIAKLKGHFTHIFTNNSEWVTLNCMKYMYIIVYVLNTPQKPLFVWKAIDTILFSKYSCVSHIYPTWIYLPEFEWNLVGFTWHFCYILLEHVQDGNLKKYWDFSFLPENLGWNKRNCLQIQCSWGITKVDTYSVTLYAVFYSQ